jgi:gluconate 5-dehydrogenase
MHLLAARALPDHVPRGRAPYKINVNVVARIPLRRIAEPEDVRNTVLFLASPAPDFITGQTIYLDGGITATQ